MKKIRPSTRQAIIEAAFQLYKDNPASSLADIAEQAGIGRATLHRHFKGRDDLLCELAKIAIKDIDQAVNQLTTDASSYSEALKLTIDAVLPLGDRQWFLYQESLESHPEIQAEFQRQSDELSAVINEAKKEGCFDSSLPTSWITQTFDHLIFAGWEMVKMEESTPKQAAKLVWETLINGTGKKEGASQ
jgi:AcrR family transcriptional regulator